VVAFFGLDLQFFYCVFRVFSVDLVEFSGTVAFEKMNAPTNPHEWRSNQHTLAAAVALVFPFMQIASALDENADGLSDVWQRTFNIASGEAGLDFDGDGFTNQEESALGTDPRIYDAPPAPDFVDDQCALRWKTVTAVRYEVQYSTDLTLANWQTVPGIVLGNGVEQIVKIPGYLRTATPHLFMRFKTLQSLDQDADGLDAIEEAMLGTSDTDSDSDGDHVPDTTEFRLQLHPASAASADGDLVPDDWEIFKIGNLASTGGQDTDGDGFTTMDEFTFDLNPAANDFANGVGMKTHTFTFDAGGQLKAVVGTLTESFDYDADGNIVTSN